MAKLTILSDVCKGCGLCIDVCPKKIMELDSSVLNKAGHHPVTCSDESACIACGSCAIMCPDSVITVEKEDK